jgi:hypothetical protein
VNRRLGRVLLLTLAGMALGYLLMHFAMLADILGPHHPPVSMDFVLLGRQLYSAFGVETPSCEAG